MIERRTHWFNYILNVRLFYSYIGHCLPIDSSLSIHFRASLSFSLNSLDCITNYEISKHIYDSQDSYWNYTHEHRHVYCMKYLWHGRNQLKLCDECTLDNNHSHFQADSLIFNHSKSFVKWSFPSITLHPYPSIHSLSLSLLSTTSDDVDLRFAFFNPFDYILMSLFFFYSTQMAVAENEKKRMKRGKIARTRFGATCVGLENTQWACACSIWISTNSKS